MLKSGYHVDYGKWERERERARERAREREK